LRFEETAISAGVAIGQHENAIAAIMNSARITRGWRCVRLNDLPDKQTVLVDEAGIRQPAFEIGVAFRNERGIDLLTGSGRQSELLEFINVAA
jgi:hypothetical protein